MSARIYSPAKTAMQSGKGKTGRWILEFDRSSPKGRDPLMGYVSSSDPAAQIRLTFDTREDAIGYARKHGIDHRVEEPKATKRRRIAYADNFSYNRQTPWTH